MDFLNVNPFAPPTQDMFSPSMPPPIPSELSASVKQEAPPKPSTSPSQPSAPKSQPTEKAQVTEQVSAPMAQPQQVPTPVPVPIPIPEQKIESMGMTALGITDNDAIPDTRPKYPIDYSTKYSTQEINQRRNDFTTSLEMLRISGANIEGLKLSDYDSKRLALWESAGHNISKYNQMMYKIGLENGAYSQNFSDVLSYGITNIASAMMTNNKLKQTPGWESKLTPSQVESTNEILTKVSSLNAQEQAFLMGMVKDPLEAFIKDSNSAVNYMQFVAQDQNTKTTLKQNETKLALEGAGLQAQIAYNKAQIELGFQTLGLNAILGQSTMDYQKAATDNIIQENKLAPIKIALEAYKHLNTNLDVINGSVVQQYNVLLSEQKSIEAKVHSAIQKQAIKTPLTSEETEALKKNEYIIKKLSTLETVANRATDRAFDLIGPDSDLGGINKSLIILSGMKSSGQTAKGKLSTYDNFDNASGHDSVAAADVFLRTYGYGGMMKIISQNGKQAVVPMTDKDFPRKDRLTSDRDIIYVTGLAIHGFNTGVQPLSYEQYVQKVGKANVGANLKDRGYRHYLQASKYMQNLYNASERFNNSNPNLENTNTQLTR